MKKVFLLVFALLFIKSATVFGQRKVLIEQFTNSGCPPCGSVTPQEAQFANSNPSNVIMISYHTSFPYLDSMYFENPIESDQRVSFYTIPSVPFTKVDGNYFSGYLVPTINTTVPQRALITPRYSVAINNLTLS